MAPETDHAIDKGNVYIDTGPEAVNYITIEGFYVDEAGRTQVKIGQYLDKPIAAHNSLGMRYEKSTWLTLEVNDVRDRILKGELIFDGKS